MLQRGKMRKMNETMKKTIVKSMLNNINPLSIRTIATNINSNWLTTLKYLRELEKIGIIKIITIEGKTYGAELITEGYNLIDECFRELEKYEPNVFSKLLEDKRIIIVDKIIEEILEEKLMEEKNGIIQI